MGSAGPRGGTAETSPTPNSGLQEEPSSSGTQGWVTWVLLSLSVAVTFSRFFVSTARIWFTNETFSYGVVVPFLFALFVRMERKQLVNLPRKQNPFGLYWVAGGCVLHIAGTLSGALLLSGIGFVLVLMGIIQVLFGSSIAKRMRVPLTFLLLMVPWPPYIVGRLEYLLQAYATSMANAAMHLLGIPSFEDGNLLILPNYTLSVDEACSGTRSLFALLAIAAAICLWVQKRWGKRFILLVSAPALALIMNVVRLIGTGIAASRWGRAAAEGTVHAIWGVVIFVTAVGALLALEKSLEWQSQRQSSL